MCQIWQISNATLRIITIQMSDVAEMLIVKKLRCERLSMYWDYNILHITEIEETPNHPNQWKSPSFFHCYLKLRFNWNWLNDEQLESNDFYRPQTKFRQGNVFTDVCDSVHRGCLVLVQGGIRSRECLVRGVPGPRGWGGVPGGDPHRTATAVGGTHPTGMHSCFTIGSSGDGISEV